MANAAGHLRTNESHCGSGDLHNHKFGLDGTVSGKHGPTQLADLATVICSYDTTAGYSSNSLSSYFHDLGWRGRLNDLVQNWLLKDQTAKETEVSQTLGGNYGEVTPSDLTLDVTSPTAASTRYVLLFQKLVFVYFFPINFSTNDGPSDCASFPSVIYPLLLR